jgi:hypothetical protein
MNDALASEIRELAAHGASPSTIVRRILAHEDHWQMSRLALFKELREQFDVDFDAAARTAGWNYWDGEGFDDAELDELLRGKLRPKEAQAEKA